MFNIDFYTTIFFNQTIGKKDMVISPPKKNIRRLDERKEENLKKKLLVTK